MRRQAFAYDSGDQAPGFRHHARAINFNDQSVFSYRNANKNWWGYA